MRRSGILVLALVLAAAAVAPSCMAACCQAQSREARMMAMMPCCAGDGSAMRARMMTGASPEGTLTAGVSVAPSIVAVVPVVERAASFELAPAIGPDLHTPPIFLRDLQFRI